MGWASYGLDMLLGVEHTYDLVTGVEKVGLGWASISVSLADNLG